MPSLATFISFVLIASVLNAHANADNKASDNGKYDELISSGLVMDKTITPIGRHFYKEFMAYWTAPRGLSDYTITIIERFNPQWGSIAWISVDDDIIYQQLISSRRLIMEDLAKDAVRQVLQFMVKREIIKRYKGSMDLEGDGY